MKGIILLLALALSGCATWNELDTGEKVALGVGVAVLVGANIIKNSQGDYIENDICISTRSLETGCWP